MVHSDFSRFAIGAALIWREDESRGRPVRFDSRAWNNFKVSHSAFKRGTTRSILHEMFRRFFLAVLFFVYRDHRAPRPTFQKNVHGRLARWLDLLSEDQFEIKHVARKKISAEDYLIRSIGEAEKPVQTISDEIESCFALQLLQNDPGANIVLLTALDRPLE